MSPDTWHASTSGGAQKPINPARIGLLWGALFTLPLLVPMVVVLDSAIHASDYVLLLAPFAAALVLILAGHWWATSGFRKSRLRLLLTLLAQGFATAFALAVFGYIWAWWEETTTTPLDKRAIVPLLIAWGIASVWVLALGKVVMWRVRRVHKTGVIAPDAGDVRASWNLWPQLTIGLAALAALGVASFVYLRLELVNRAEQFFDAVQHDDLAMARKQLFSSFAKYADEGLLNTFLAENHLSNAKNVDLSIDSFRGLHGQLKGTAGDVPVRLSLFRDRGQWKITELCQLEKADCLNTERALAERGDPHAQFLVGLDYQNDLRWSLPMRHDYVKAAAWYRKAAEQGDADAQIALGELYDEGQGVSQDSAAAIRWFSAAANQDGSLPSANAKAKLSAAYVIGRGMVQPDDTQALAYFHGAAKLLKQKGFEAPEDVACKESVRYLLKQRQSPRDAFLWISLIDLKGQCTRPGLENQLSVDEIATIKAKVAPRRAALIALESSRALDGGD